MKVTCERCGTEYNFDDAQVTEAGVKVKCTRCEHVFRVRKRAFVVTEPASGAATTAEPSKPEPSREEPSQPGASLPGNDEPSGRRWTIRKFDRTQLEFNEMTTLQRWIVERKVGPEDEISHNGVKWKRLGAIPELGPFFDVVNGAASDANDKTAPAFPAPGRAEAAERAERAKSAPAPARKGSGATLLLLAIVVIGAGAAWAQLTAGGLAATASLRDSLFASTGVDLRVHAAATATPAPTASAVVAAPSPSAAPSTTAVAVESAAPSATQTVATAPSPAPSPSATATAVAAISPKPTAHPAKAGTEELLNQGYELYSRGKYREAIRKYQAAVDSDQNNSEAWALLGLAYLDDGQDELAESCLQSSIRLNSRFADSHRYLGLLYSRRGDKTKAIQEFNTYLDLRPSGPTSDDVRKRVASLQGG